MARKEQDILRGISGIGSNATSTYEQQRLDNQEKEEWQRNLELAGMAAKMNPETSLGFSLGRLIFANADNWFGHKGRNKDGTKHGTAAGAAGTAATPATGAQAYDFSQFKTSDPLQAMANAGDSHAQFAMDARQNDPFGMKPGQFGTDEYAQQNGISLQQNTFNPNTQEATSTTLSTNNPELLTGGQYSFNSPQLTLGGGMNNASGLSSDGFFGGMAGGDFGMEAAAEGLFDPDKWKLFGTVR